MPLPLPEREVSLWLTITPDELRKKLKKAYFKEVRPHILQTTYVYLPPKRINHGGFMRIRTMGKEIHVTIKGGIKDAGNGIKERSKYTLDARSIEEGRLFAETCGYVFCNIRERFSSKYKRGTAKIDLNENPYGWVVDIQADTVKDIFEIRRELGLFESDVLPVDFLVFNYWKEFCQIHGLSESRDITFEHISSVPRKSIAG